MGIPLNLADPLSFILYNLLVPDGVVEGRFLLSLSGSHLFFGALNDREFSFSSIYMSLSYVPLSKKSLNLMKHVVYFL